MSFFKSDPQIFPIKIVFTVAFLLGIFNGQIKGQSYHYDWSKVVSSNKYERGIAVVVDDLGSVYTGGAFRDQIDLNPGTGVHNVSSVGDYDVYLQKLDSNGAFVWGLSYGGLMWDDLSDIDTDGEYIYLTGTFRGTVDFDPGIATNTHISNGFEDNYVLKFDLNGNLKWAISFGGIGNDDIRSVSVDDSGNVYVTGEFRNVVDFDPGNGSFNVTAIGNADAFILKLDSLGQLDWVKIFGGQNLVKAYSIDVKFPGFIYCSGEFSGSVDFDPGSGAQILTSQGLSYFYLKLTSNGEFEWVNSIKTGNSPVGMEHYSNVASDDLGNLFVVGTFGGVVDFNPGPGTDNRTATGVSDIFVLKFDSSANLEWLHSFGGDYGNAYDVKMDKANNMNIVGIFIGKIDLDPGPDSLIMDSQIGSYTTVFAKYSNTGEILWGSQLGTVGSNISYSLFIDQHGYLYSTGSFNFWGIDFDPGPAVKTHNFAGILDGYTLKYYCDATYGVDNVIACNSLTWLDGNTYTQNNNTAKFVIANHFGCDSVVTLNLSIVPLDMSISQNASSLSANTAGTGVTFQWLDCENNNALIPGATNASFNPSTNGSYAVVMSKNGCIDTTECYSMQYVGVDEFENSNLINIYPNPTHNRLTVDAQFITGSFNISMINASGQMVGNWNFSNQKKVELQINLPSGIYSLLVTHDNGVERVSVVID